MEIDGVLQLPPEECHARFKDGAVLLDVRGRGERAAARVPGSMWIPMQEIAARTAELPKDRTIIVQCAAGFRSQAVAAFLAPQGFDVANQVHGLQGWAAAGLPVAGPEEEM